MKNLYHYVYRITNTKINKHYYGVRTSKQEPHKDLGIKYFSSSTDEEFKSDQKTNPQDYKYKVVSIRDTREEAVGLEVRLHARFNVGVNESFYNKVKQTSICFDYTGLEHSEETRKKMSELQRGRVFTAEHKAKLSVAGKGKKKRKAKHPCKHCGIANISNIVMTRYHNDNCKHNPISTRYKPIKTIEERKAITSKKLSKLHKGKPKSAEHILKMSESRKGKKKPTSTCEHCNKTLARAAITQWHNDNCKQNPARHKQHKSSKS